MRRVYGFMILALVVISGVLYVESDHRAAAFHGDDSVFNVVLGDGRAAAPERYAPDGAPRPGTSPGRRPGETSETGRPGGPAEPPGGEPVAAPSAKPPQPVPLTPDPPETYRYTVRSGDTLGKIALAHLGSASRERIERLRVHNQLPNSDAIRPGDILIIPVVAPEKHTTSGTESLRDIAKKRFGSASRVEALLKANPALPTNDRDPLPRGLVIWIPR